jgi:hypothetical protein
MPGSCFVTEYLRPEFNGDKAALEHPDLTLVWSNESETFIWPFWPRWANSANIGGSCTSTSNSVGGGREGIWRDLQSAVRHDTRYGQ